MDNLILYRKTKEYIYLYEYIKEKFYDEEYHSVILYALEYLEKCDDRLIRIYLIYAYCNLNYKNLAKNLFKLNKENICNYFLNNSEISIDYLFKILIYLEINIDDISQYITDFEKKYYNNYFYKYYKNQLLEEKENEELEFNYKQHHNYYEDKDIKIVSYNTDDDMGICTIIKVGEDVLLVDCGARQINEKKELMDIKKYLSDNNINQGNIKGVLITHAHLDHYGSLNYFEDTNIPIYTTQITLDLIKKMNRMARENKISINKLSINNINPNETFNIDKFKITPLKNGHIIGSVAYYIETSNKKILCSGDFCLNEQHTVAGLDLNKYPKNVDILLCESTYGKKEYTLKREDREKMIAILMEDAKQCGLCVFMPSFAIGRAQELIAIKKKYNVDMLVNVDGSAKGMTKYYQKHSDMKRLYNDGVKAINHDVNIDMFEEPKVYITTSGMLYSNSTFNTKYLPYIMCLNCIVLKTGYIPANNKTLESIKENNKINFFDISLSAHAPYEDLLKFINYINPQVLVTNHGKGIEI